MMIRIRREKNVWSIPHRRVLWFISNKLLSPRPGTLLIPLLWPDSRSRSCRMRSTAAALVLLLVVVSARGFHGAERLPPRGVLDGRHLRRSLNAVYNLRGGNGPVLDATEPIDIETELELEEALEAAGDRLVVVDFHAEWCKPCKMIGPVVDELARKAGGKVVFLKVDVRRCLDPSQPSRRHLGQRTRIALGS